LKTSKSSSLLKKKKKQESGFKPSLGRMQDACREVPMLGSSCRSSGTAHHFSIRYCKQDEWM